MKFKKAIAISAIVTAMAGSNANASGGVGIVVVIPSPDPVSIGVSTVATIGALLVGTTEGKKIGRETNRVHRQIEKSTKKIRRLFKW